ncbi:MAG: PEP-CTERM sorting domain-containing protein, partial [Deltaproteobacteria bacterium]|nr:PEP-CTERM sorting domain-containing protein [Deltaproteobacteria bacterium]MBW2117559.1 PEP-CTERM sorting domain-containing protein [Deltaproteobacteria bacterium]MBW2345168.1 PEP-CTERM sorting domain-containing protein [Deltaproteobacteria bacterium]
MTDNNPWYAWDYIAYSGGDNAYDPHPKSEGFWSVDDNYEYVYVDYSSGRTGHVNGIDGDDLTSASGLTSVTLTEYASAPDTLIYLFDNIALDDDFVIGYTPWCANDVFLTPVPEPATMLLLGCGLIGLAGIGRKKFFKKG